MVIPLYPFPSAMGLSGAVPTSTTEACIDSDAKLGILDLDWAWAQGTLGIYAKILTLAPYAASFVRQRVNLSPY